jgi:hypothetical protein
MTFTWNTKTQIIVTIILVVAAFGAGRYLTPTKVVTKTQVVTQTNDIIHDHIHTVVVTNPNGTTTTTTDNNSVIDDKTDTDSNSSTVTTYSKPQWKVSGMAGLSVNSLSTPIYGAQVERRILGPISAGIWGLSNSTGGVALSLEF